MTIFYAVLAGWVVLAAFFITSLAWAARGEGDVNGDPERDSGEEI
jgi:SNF family Na+-dependent transporter